jgi:hypothetical protein
MMAMRIAYMLHVCNNAPFWTKKKKNKNKKKKNNNKKKNKNKKKKKKKKDERFKSVTHLDLYHLPSYVISVEFLARFISFWLPSSSSSYSRWLISRPYPFP